MLVWLDLFFEGGRRFICTVTFYQTATLIRFFLCELLILLFMLLLLRFLIFLIYFSLTFFSYDILLVTIVMHLTELLHYKLLSGYFIYFWLLNRAICSMRASNLDLVVSFLSWFFWYSFLALYKFAIDIVFLILKHSVYRFDVLVGYKAKTARLMISISHNDALLNRTIDRKVVNKLWFGSGRVNTANKDFLDIMDAGILVVWLTSLIVVLSLSGRPSRVLVFQGSCISTSSRNNTTTITTFPISTNTTLRMLIHLF